VYFSVTAPTTAQEVPQYITVVRRTPEGILAPEVYSVLHAEPIPRFAVDLAPHFGGSVPPGIEVRARERAPELDTYGDELWLLEYEQPLPVLLGVGYGGTEARHFTGYRSLSPMRYPPRGTLSVFQTVTAGSTAPLAAALSGALAPVVGQQYVPLEIRGLYAYSATAGATLELKDVTPLGAVTLVKAVTNVAEPRFRAPVYGRLDVTAAGGDVTVALRVRWRSPRYTIAVGLGESIYFTAVNLTGQTLTSLPLQLWGVRYRVRREPAIKEPRGPVVYMYPYPGA
jgi:hypothetical protein